MIFPPLTTLSGHNRCLPFLPIWHDPFSLTTPLPFSAGPLSQWSLLSFGNLSFFCAQPFSSFPFFEFYGQAFSYRLPIFPFFPCLFFTGHPLYRPTIYLLACLSRKRPSQAPFSLPSKVFHYPSPRTQPSLMHPRPSLFGATVPSPNVPPALSFGTR